MSCRCCVQGTSSDNVIITAVGSCSVTLSSEGEGWGYTGGAGAMDLQRIPKDTQGVLRQEAHGGAGDPKSALAHFQCCNCPGGRGRSGGDSQGRSRRQE